jgi:hypothetical protein
VQVDEAGRLSVLHDDHAAQSCGPSPHHSDLAGIVRRLWWLIPTAGLIAYGIRTIIGLSWPTYGGDWFVFWFTAKAPVDALYRDLHAFPFAYPPTALLLVRPFGLLPAWPAFAAWSVAGSALLYAAARMLGATRKAFLLAVLMPPMALCLVAGQTGLFVGAAVMAGVAVRDARVSAACFGLAVALKPQAVFALPFALLAIGDFRRLALTGAIAISLAGVTVALWGTDVWLAWVDALPRFQQMLIDRGADRLDVGLNGLRLRLGLRPWVYGVGVGLGIVSSAMVWLLTEHRMVRYAAIAAGSVLISPYTLLYDLTGLSVAALSLLLCEAVRGRTD